MLLQLVRTRVIWSQSHLTRIWVISRLFITHDSHFLPCYEVHIEFVLQSLAHRPYGRAVKALAFETEVCGFKSHRGPFFVVSGVLYIHSFEFDKWFPWVLRLLLSMPSIVLAWIQWCFYWTNFDVLVPSLVFLQNFYFAIFLCVGTHMFALHDSVVYGYDRYLDATVVMLAAFARWCNAFESL